MAKLLIVEDEPELGSLLQQHLQGEGHTVQLERDGRDALESCRFTAFDLIILDLMLPGLDGLEVARRIRQPRVPLNNVSFDSAGLEHATSATVPILMLTARAEESDRVLGFEVGADDYIAKPFSLREMLARVRAMLRRSQITKEATAASVEVIRLGKLEIDLAARSVKIGSTVTDLTPREYDLLLMLAHHPGRTFSRDYLLERIWGTSFEGSDRVVDTTVVRLRRKLLEEGERVVSVWGVGYRLDA